MKFDLEKIRYAIVYILLFIMFVLLLVGVVYAIKHYNADQKINIKDFDTYYTISEDQLDIIAQPAPGLPLTLNTLPKTVGTITEIDFKNVKKLFQNKKKSIMILVSDICDSCKNYYKTLEEVLEDQGLFVYKVNLSKLSTKEMKELKEYIDYDGLPTTYIINKGKAQHSLTGSVDKETLEAFIDYFYTREN